MNLRLTLVLVVVLLMVGGYVVLYELRKPPDRTPPEPFFYDVSMEAITSVEVTHEAEAAAFKLDDQTREAACAEVAAGLRCTQRFVWSDEKSQWVFDDGKDTPVFQDRWGGITLLLSGPRVTRLLSEEESDPSRYGLTAPTSTIRVGMADGRTIELLLGATTPDGQNVYAMRPPSPQIALVVKSWADVITRLVTEPPFVPTPTPTPEPAQTPEGSPTPATPTPTAP